MTIENVYFWILITPCLRYQENKNSDTVNPMHWLSDLDVNEPVTEKIVNVFSGGSPYRSSLWIVSHYLRCLETELRMCDRGRDGFEFVYHSSFSRYTDLQNLEVNFYSLLLYL